MAQPSVCLKIQHCLLCFIHECWTAAAEVRLRCLCQISSYEVKSTFAQVCWSIANRIVCMFITISNRAEFEDKEKSQNLWRIFEDRSCLVHAVTGPLRAQCAALKDHGKKRVFANPQPP